MLLLGQAGGEPGAGQEGLLGQALEQAGVAILSRRSLDMVEGYHRGWGWGLLGQLLERVFAETGRIFGWNWGSDW